MTLKTLTIKTCKSCGRSYYIDDKTIKLEEGDEIEIVESFSKCTDCKVYQDRQMKSRRNQGGNQTHYYEAP